MKTISYVESEGWVTQEWMMWAFIKSMEQTKEFELFAKALTEKQEQIHE